MVPLEVYWSRRTWLGLMLSAAATAGISVPAQAAGRFFGKVKAEISDTDDVYMTLLEPLVYLDPRGVRWEAPAGVRFNGASIPKVFWSVIGGPYEGRYRIPSILHDYYCDVHQRPWWEVHRMFYEAMLTAGVGAAKAKIMYLAVLYGGPRWDAQSIYNTKLAATPRGDAGDLRNTKADPALAEPALEQLRVQAEAEARSMNADERRALRDPKASAASLKALLDTQDTASLSLDAIDQIATKARLGQMP